MWGPRLDLGPRKQYENVSSCVSLKAPLKCSKRNHWALKLDCLNHGSSPNYLVTVGREFTSLNLSFFFFFFKMRFLKGKII